ncbi:MAG: STAS domain-containing protein [Deltaproteobacteria bacterium]|nr:STAS domain-containing protein [Deltaproteobacteria bacterium]
MDLQEKRYGTELAITVSGRLDASWAEFFQEHLLRRVRAGEHRLILDVADLSFLSSMGIRALMAVYKELKAIGGTFRIIRASGMVHDTLRKSGLGQWLSDAPLDAVTPAPDGPAAVAATPPGLEHFPLAAEGGLSLEKVDAWRPWQAVNPQMSREIRFTPDGFGLGIGGAGETLEAAGDYLGEFVAFNGQVAAQPPDERGRPDCLLSEGEFVPSLHCVQALVCRGPLSHLLRFRADDERPCYPLSRLLAEMFRVSGAEAIGFLVVGEVEGLVGASLITSPGRLRPGMEIRYPQVREWLSFSGERAFAREQAVIVGVARRTGQAGPEASGLVPVAVPAGEPPMAAHMHAAVFPFQMLPNGRIEAARVAARLFSGPPPRAVLHLVDDDRPGNGLGESALYQGACWFGAITEGGELL